MVVDTPSHGWPHLCSLEPAVITEPDRVLCINTTVFLVCSAIRALCYWHGQCLRWSYGIVRGNNQKYRDYTITKYKVYTANIKDKDHAIITHNVVFNISAHKDYSL